MRKRIHKVNLTEKLNLKCLCENLFGIFITNIIIMYFIILFNIFQILFELKYVK